MGRGCESLLLVDLQVRARGTPDSPTLYSGVYVIGASLLRQRNIARCHYSHKSPQATETKEGACGDLS